jgi:potassium-dependent mechanosensitive channel
MYIRTVLLFLLSAIPFHAVRVQAQVTEPSKPLAKSNTAHPVNVAPVSPPTPADQSIPLALIADRAQELDRSLVEISRRLRSIEESLSTDGRPPVPAKEIGERLLFVDSLVSGVPTVIDLRDENYYWITLNRRYDTYRKSLTSRATYLEDQLHFLDGREAQWQATWDQIVKSRTIQPIVEQVGQELNKIRFTRKQLQNELTLVLTVQSTASQQNQQITEALSKLNKAQEVLRGHMLERDGYSLWDLRAFRDGDQSLKIPILEAIVRGYKDAGAFVRANVLFLVPLLFMYALALAAALKLKRYVSAGPELKTTPIALKIFSRPFSVALLLTLLGTIGRLNKVTTGVACIVVWVWLIQASRLLPPLIGPKARSVFWTMIPFSVLESIRTLIPFSAILKRELFVLNVFCVFVTLIWLNRKWIVRRLEVPSNGTRVFRVGVRVVIVLFGASLVCNFFGYRSLSQALGLSAFLGFIAAATLYGGFRVVTLVLITLLRTDWAQSVLGAHTKAVEYWGSRGLAIGAGFAWVRGMLQLFAIYDPLMGAASGILQHQVGYGNVHFTLGGVLSVILTVLIGYVLANFFTLIMNQLVLPKFQMPRGMPYAISKVTYYGLLTLVATTALADAGMELSKLTVLTGALGVGLGFGLQNIVNNFVSGLILLFERPVHVGDTIDVGGLVGRVRRIGARSSTVLTFQGAEVIVPNSNLISNQVINWTLSSAWRRVDIPVYVAYGTDPERVLELLVEAANSHPGVLRERPSAAFFLGFGDNALNFELRFWSAHQETWFDLRSEVTLAIAKALDKADIKIPFPQREIHLHNIAASAGECLPGNDSRLTTPVPASSLEHSSAPLKNESGTITGKENLAGSASQTQKW